MEANRRHRGFKGKMMMPLYRAPKPSIVQVSSKVKPTPSSLSTASLCYVGEDEVLNPAAKQKASSVKKEGGDFSVGGAVGGEDSIDKRAAAYISCVQERFKLELIDCERRKYY